MGDDSSSISYGLKDIEVVDFHELSLVSVISKNEIEIPNIDNHESLAGLLDDIIKLTLDSNVAYVPNLNNNHVLFAHYFIKVEYGIAGKPEYKPAIFLSLEARYTFEIHDRSEKLQFGELEPIADELVSTFATVVFSTTRGLLYGLMKNPIMHKTILPLLPMKDVIGLFKLPQRSSETTEKAVKQKKHKGRK